MCAFWVRYEQCVMQWDGCQHPCMSLGMSMSSSISMSAHDPSLHAAECWARWESRTRRGSSGDCGGRRCGHGPRRPHPAERVCAGYACAVCPRAHLPATQLMHSLLVIAGTHMHAFECTSYTPVHRAAPQAAFDRRRRSHQRPCASSTRRGHFSRQAAFRWCWSVCLRPSRPL